MQHQQEHLEEPEEKSGWELGWSVCWAPTSMATIGHFEWVCRWRSPDGAVPAAACRRQGSKIWHGNEAMILVSQRFLSLQVFILVCTWESSTWALAVQYMFQKNPETHPRNYSPNMEGGNQAFAEKRQGAEIAACVQLIPGICRSFQSSNHPEGLATGWECESYILPDAE